MAIDEALTTVADPAVTLPVAPQPIDSAETAMVAPRQTVVVIEQTMQPLDRCRARLKGRPEEFCAQHPVEGRRRCRIHGGLTPVGRESPHFVHGHDSRYPVPLTEREQTRYEEYLRAVFDPARHDLASDLALARIQRDRAVAAGDRAVAEAGAVARLALAHSAITKGNTLRVVPDEAIVSRLADLMMGAVEGCVFEALDPAAGKSLLAAVGLRMRALDWSQPTNGDEPN